MDEEFWFLLLLVLLLRTHCSPPWFSACVRVCVRARTLAQPSQRSCSFTPQLLISYFESLFGQELLFVRVYAKSPEPFRPAQPSGALSVCTPDSRIFRPGVNNCKLFTVLSRLSYLLLWAWMRPGRSFVVSKLSLHHRMFCILIQHVVNTFSERFRKLHIIKCKL